MAEKGRYDWIGSLTPRIRKAYKPPVMAPIFQALSQGFVGRKIGQDELRKAIMTAMMGKYTPMVGEEPATMEQIMGAMRGKPGVISRLFGAKPPEELTWEPIKEEKALTIQERALKAVEEGIPLPGTTMKETKRLAKITPEKERQLTLYQEIQEEEELARVVGAIRGKRYYLPGTLGAMMPKTMKTREEAIQFLSTPPPGYEAHPDYENIPEIMKALEETYPNYKTMTEKELFEKVKAGDLEARAEAIKRGYLKR